MPELAELALMRDFVNRFAGGHIFHRVHKGPCTTGKIGRSPEIVLPKHWGSQFQMFAYSRGKELKVILRAANAPGTLQRTASTAVFADTDIQGRLNKETASELGPTGSARDHKAIDDIVSERASLTPSHVKTVTQRLIGHTEANGDADSSVSNSAADPQASIEILFRAGMTGYFDKVSSPQHLHKHAHLSFYRQDGTIVSFVDQRRFGSWHLNNSWGEKRSPCPVEEYLEFRANVLQNLHKSTFNSDLCETLLDQEFFNGIGNYLRAEICYRANANPFMRARDAFLPLLSKEERAALEEKLNKPASSKRKGKGKGKAAKAEEDEEAEAVVDDEPAEEQKEGATAASSSADSAAADCTWSDILELCHIVPREVHRLRFKDHDMEAAYDPPSEADGIKQEEAAEEAQVEAIATKAAQIGEAEVPVDTKYTSPASTGYASSVKPGITGIELHTMTFQMWLQCYAKDNMRSTKDKHGRAMWYDRKWRPKVYRPVRRTSKGKKGKSEDVEEAEQEEAASSSEAEEEAAPVKPEEETTPTRKRAAAKKSAGRSRKASVSSTSASESDSAAPSTPAKRQSKTTTPRKSTPSKRKSPAVKDEEEDETTTPTRPTRASKATTSKPPTKRRAVRRTAAAT